MYRVFIILVALCVFSNGRNFHMPTKYAPIQDERIIGGEDANIKDLPYQLSIENHYGWHICGASIISSTWALTAGHCINHRRPSMLFLRAGSSILESFGSLHNVSTIILHPLYNWRNVDYDYGLLQVFDPFPLGQPGVQAIRLADEEPIKGDVATVSGWGKLGEDGPHSTLLQRVDVHIINRDTCQELYGKYEITERMICAGDKDGGKDSCQGDSGGPLTSRGRLVGVISWGFGCGEIEYPGVYSNVATQREWIREHTGI